MASAAVHALTLLLCRSKNKTLLSAIWKKGLLIEDMSSPGRSTLIGTIGDGDHKMSGAEANYTGIIDGPYSSNNWLLIRNNIFANLPVVQ